MVMGQEKDVYLVHDLRHESIRNQCSVPSVQVHGDRNVTCPEYKSAIVDLVNPQGFLVLQWFVQILDYLLRAPGKEIQYGRVVDRIRFVQHGIEHEESHFPFE